MPKRPREILTPTRHLYQMTFKRKKTKKTILKETVKINFEKQKTKNEAPEFHLRKDDCAGRNTAIHAPELITRTGH